MNRLSWLAPLLLALACGSNPSVIPAGDFSGPTGLAIAPLPDRDLLFVANQGSNELRAIMLCTAPTGAPTTCPDREDQQLLPAPIRLVPGSIAAGKRPLRLAGARLTVGGAPHGAVLVAGLDTVPNTNPPQNALRVIDAADLFAASQDRSKQAAQPTYVRLTDPPIDVVAADTQDTSVTAVAATQPPTGGPGGLTVITVTVGGDGLAIGTATRQCALDFVPARLAAVPGDAALQRVYVADGTPGGTPGGIGDGAVEVSVPDIPAIAAPPAVPAPCPVTRRLPASDPADSPRLARPLRSIALSPAFTNNSAQVAAGSLLLGVTSEDEALCTNHAALTCPADLPVATAGRICVDHGTRSCGRGRLVLISTNVGGQSALLPAPPTPLNASGAPPMAPLSPPTPAREVAFAVTGLRLFATGGASTLVQPPVVGLVSAEDGTTYFLDVVNRRFFNDSRDTGGGLPPLLQLNLPSSQPVAGPTFTPAAPAPGASTQFDGWVNPGVTRSAQWKVVWHSTMPRLESLGGNLSRAPGSPTVAFQLPPGKSLAPWTSAPELQLGAGDFVRVLSYSGSNLCGALGTVPVSVDVPIAAIDPNGLGMQLQPVTGFFDPGPECFASVVGAVLEVHAGSTAAGAWMVFEGLDALGRLPTGVQFVILGPRLDYPFNPPDPPPPPPPARDLVVAFTVSGTDPTTPDSFFSFTVQPIVNGNLGADSQTISGIRDNSTTGLALGLAGPILVYSSPRRPDPNFFTALTGANSLMRATPSQFGLPNTDYVRFFY